MALEYVSLRSLADFTTRQVHSLEDFATQRHMDLQTSPCRWQTHRLEAQKLVCA